MKTKIYFKEEQKLDVWWLKVLIVGLLFVSLGPIYYGLITQLSTGVPWGDEPMSDTGLIIVSVVVTLIMAGVIFFMFFSKLTTLVRGDGIHLSFFPFFREKIISPNKIERYEVRKYKPLLEYGGYGMKRSLRHGKAYNMSGNIGLQLYFSNGKRLLIGTKRPDAIKGQWIN
jgi:hypothetical protein